MRKIKRLALYAESYGFDIFPVLFLSRMLKIIVVAEEGSDSVSKLDIFVAVTAIIEEISYYS